MLKAVYYKLKAMAGGSGMLLALPLAAVLCFFTVGRVLQSESAQSLRVAVVNLDRSELSEAYLADLSRTEGLELIPCGSETAARKALERDRAEAMLCIDTGFGEAVQDGGTLPLRYTGGATGSAGQAAREIVGGRALALQSGYNALRRLEADGLLTAENEARFWELLDEARESSRPLTEFHGGGGSGASAAGALNRLVFDGTGPRYSGFAALVMALAVLSLSVLLSSPEAPAVNRRCAAFRGGRTFGPLTDLLALTVAGLLVALAALLCRGALGLPPANEMGRTLLLAPALAAVSALLARSRAGGGIDTVAPLLALALAALAGGF